MISLTISDVANMTAQDAAAVRAVVEIYHPSGTHITPTLGEVTIENPVIKSPEGKPFSFGRHPPDAPSLADQFTSSVKKTAERIGAVATVKVLDPADNPAAGAADHHDIAAQVFTGGGLPTSEPDPAVVFSGGAHGTPELDADAAKLEALAGPGAAGMTLAEVDPAAVFSGGATDVAAVFAGMPLPNVQSGTPGPQPSQPGTPQTLPPPSPGATNDSPPPPPPPAPGPDSASAGAPSTPGVQVDKAGLPWDARIHAGTKSITAKGVWMRRRGIEDSLVAEVEAQLKAAMAIPTPPPADTAAPWPFPQDASGVTFGQPSTPPPPPPAAADQPATFPILMTFITERIGDKRLTQAQVTAAVQAAGLESINLAMARPDLIPTILAELQKVAP